MIYFNFYLKIFIEKAINICKLFKNFLKFNIEEIGISKNFWLKISKDLSKYLHYGALIYLSFVDEDNVYFYANSEGFSKKKIRLKT